MTNIHKIKPVRTGIAGCGGITPTVLRRIRRFNEFDFISVMDLNPDHVNRIANEFDIPKRHTDYQAFLKEDFELVILNSPNDCHRSQAIDALKSGKHCFVQKPLARNVAEGQEMVDVANETGKLLGVVMMERSDPVYRQIRSMVQAGCFGQITVFRSALAHVNHLKNPPDVGNWRSCPDRIGGGSFIQLAIHHLDLAQFILDQRIETVAAISSSSVNPKMFPIDETTGASVKFSDGTIGQFLSSFAASADSIEIYGTDGMIRRDEDSIKWVTSELYSGELWDAGRPGETHVLYMPDLANKISSLIDQYEPHRMFAHAIRGHGSVETPGELGVQELKIVDCVARSAAENRVVEIL